jgi:cobalamin biosynthetic protein CobC
MTEDWTWHGGNLAAARRYFGTGDLPWLDLSTGINPVPWPGADRPIDWQRLPEMADLQALELAAASCFGLDAKYVCAVPGTEIGLRLAGRLIGGDAQHLTPSYRTHGEMFEASRPVGRDGLSDRGGTIVLANPNNPDGHVIEPAALHALLVRRPDDGWLLVDEAFADFDPALSMASSVSDDAPLLAFRSFGKFFGLAGVRLGFILGPEAFLAGLRALLGAWPVSAAAVAIGRAAYADADWIAATRRSLPERAALLDAILARAGYRAAGGCPLFRLIDTDDAQDLFERLARHTILSRPFADQPRWLRLGLPADEAGLTRLAAALADG